MPFDLTTLLAERAGEAVALHNRHLNHQLVRVLKTIGFDRDYVRGEGCYLYDEEGNRYLDFLAGFGVFALGRSHPGVKRALHDAIDADLANLVQMDRSLLPGLLAEALVARAHPGIERAFLTNSGAESIEAAIKFARAATGRERIAYCDHAFHGLTTGALSLNGGEEFRKGFGDLLPGVMVPFGDADALQRALGTRNVAAFVVEPVQGKGVHLAPEGYWHAVEDVCRKTGTLFVIDEVQTGIGRTGKFFAHEHWGLAPDMITVSKALSGGYVPVGALLMTSKVHASVFASMERAMVHSSTFGQNHLAMVAGLATLATIDDERIVERAAATGRMLLDRLTPLTQRYELLADVRGLGCIVGIEFGKPRSLAARGRWKLLETARTGLFSQLIVGPLFARHRILTQVAGDNMNIVKLLPPLVAGEAEVDFFAEAFEDVLADAHRGSGLAFEFATTLVKGAMKRTPS